MSKKINSTQTENVNVTTFRDVELQEYLRQSQTEYPSWWTRERLVSWLRALPEVTAWNCYICVAALVAIVWVIIDDPGKGSPFDVDSFVRDLRPYILALDILYNVMYLMYVAAIAYNVFFVNENEEIGYCTIGGFFLDFITFLHYAITIGPHKLFKLACYYLRLHRPFRYLWELNDYNLKGSILGTTLKYCYIFFVLRVTWALIWIHVDVLERQYTQAVHKTAMAEVQLVHQQDNNTSKSSYIASQFLVAVYVVNKMFIPIGPSVAPRYDLERVACLLLMITGCLVVTGAAVASLSSVISIYMGPEEAFRARYRLIMKEMKESNIPPSLREKVETFYKMYWHKQKAVSATQLLPTFPPTLRASINTDIYFEATQKSRILCDLSYQFLSEVVKKMKTIHYIPGDTIIKRSTRKSSIIYIAYGDIEMVSAEDDSTAVVRMTRGTAVAGCAGNLAAASARAHVDIRAATFCTAHELRAPDLWRVALRHARGTDQAQIMRDSFNDHLEKVRRHYFTKIPEEVKYKSSILHFKRNLMALKEATDSEGKLLLERTDMFLEIAGCYIMRNRADGYQTDEADAICLRSTFPCILQPWSSLQIAWHSFMCCIILAVCFSYPYYMVFKKTVPVEFRVFDYVVTVLYVVDLIVHLSTGANVEEGVPITFSQTSSQQMRSQWFFLDVVATLPIFEFVENAHYAGINKLLRLPKVFRVLKSFEEVCVYNSNQLRFMSYTLLLLIACYLIAALQQGFMCFQFNYCLVSNFTHPPYWEKSTLDEETVNRLTFGLYWAISMITFTTHIEPFGVDNWHNVLYTMFILEICIVLHIFIEAVYSATIMVTTALREDYDSCIANVKNFLIRNEVDEQLRQRFINYLQLCWYTDKAYSMTNRKTSIFFDLPPHVYQDIVTRQRSKYLLSIPFMKLLNKEDLKEVSSNAKLFYTTPNEILLNTGDISNEIYLIKKGICEIVDPDSKEVVGSLGIKSHFGVLECLLRLPAYYTVRAVTHVQLFAISTKVLTPIMLLPQVKDAIEFAKEQPEFGRLAVRRQSFLQYEAPLKPPNMERFRLPRNYEADYAFLHPFNRLGFFSILRYIFPRYTIRPDGAYLGRYEWCRAGCALVSAFVFPCYTYLVLQWPALYWLTLLLDFSAYFDMAQRMLVGYFNEHGVLVYHPISTAAQYMRGAFFADLLGCLPMENLESPYRESFENNYRLTQSRQLLMLNRLLQLYRLPSVMKNLGNKIERRDILLVLKSIPIFMALLNALTCLMVFNSVNIFHSSNSDSWLIVPFQDQGGSWVNLFNKTFRFNMAETPWNMLLATYFWVVYATTTTGYNSFNPSNFHLMLILFVGMVIGAMITTYFSVRIISTRANVDKALAAYQEHIKDIRVYMRRENLDEKLQKEVMSYYEYNWEKMGGVEHTSVLKLCDQITLRTDAIMHIYGPTFAKCPLLANCDVSLLRLLGRAVRSLYFLRDMQLVEEDDVITNIFFVDYGCVAIRSYSSTESLSESNLGGLTTLTRGSVFGNLENATTVRSPVSIVAATRTHVLQINAAAFRHIITDFPQVADTMEKYRQQNANYIVGSSDGLKKQNPSLAAVLATTRRGIRHLYFKDEWFQLYLIIVCLSCLYADLYNAGFQVNNMPIIIVLYALDVMFYLKIVMQFVLRYNMPEDMESAFLSIRRAYFKNEFKYDILSILPLELISLCCGKHKWMAFSHLRLNRLFRIVTIYNCLKKWHSRITMNLMFSTVFSVLVWFTLFVHTAACLWYFISLLEDNVTPRSSWIYNDTGQSLCHNLYVCSTYFILTTFTQNGVGDIMPRNHAEVIFVSTLQIISTMVYMVYVGEFSNIIQFQSFRSFSFYCKYLELQEFLKNNRVSKNLVSTVNRYTLHMWRECRGMQLPHFLNTAPQSLKLRVMSAAYMHHLIENPVFSACEPAFLRQLVGCLQLYTYNEGMYVVKESEITDAMYLIHTGRVVETSAAAGDRKQFTSSECFGVEQGLIYNNPYIYSYKTVIKSQVLTLQLHDWEYLLDHFPKTKRSVYKYLKRSDTDDSFPPKGKKPTADGRRPGMSPGLTPTSHRSSMNSRKPMSHQPPPPKPPSPPPSPPRPPVESKFSPLAAAAAGKGLTSPSPSSAIPQTEVPPLKKTLPVVLTQPTTSDVSQTTTTGQTTSAGENTADAGPEMSDALHRTSQTKIKSEPYDTSLVKTTPDEKAMKFSSEPLSKIANTPKVPDAALTTSSKSNEPLPVTQTDQTTPLTEPIAAHPYSSVSLEITELPPSVTNLSQKSKKSSVSRSLTINEAFDIDVDNELKLGQTEFIWPMGSSHSADASIFDPSIRGERSDIESGKSQQSLQDQRNKRGPTDVDEAFQNSMSLIDKVEKRAKSLFSRKKDSESDYAHGSQSSDKDLLLLEEDEEATSALLHEIDIELEKVRKKIANEEVTEIVAADEAASLRSDELKPQTVRIQEPIAGDSLAVVLYDHRSDATTSKFINVDDDAQETMPATSKKSVRYKEESFNIRDSPKSSKQSLEIGKPENKSSNKKELKSIYKKEAESSDPKSGDETEASELSIEKGAESSGTQPRVETRANKSKDKKEAESSDPKPGTETRSSEPIDKKEAKSSELKPTTETKLSKSRGKKEDDPKIKDDANEDKS